MFCFCRYLGGWRRRGRNRKVKNRGRGDLKGWRKNKRRAEGGGSRFNIFYLSLIQTVLIINDLMLLSSLYRVLEPLEPYIFLSYTLTTLHLNPILPSLHLPSLPLPSAPLPLPLLPSPPLPSPYIYPTLPCHPRTSSSPASLPTYTSILPSM